MANHLRDLTGTQFGLLTVIRRAPDRGGRTCWYCTCSCSPGREVSIRMDILTRPRSIKSCGCRRLELIAASARKSDTEIGYGTAHDRVRKARGEARAQGCTSCGCAATDWALRKEAGTRYTSSEGAWAGLPFSPDPDDYQPMCRGCHSSYDSDVPWRPQPRTIRGIRERIISGEFATGQPVPSTAGLASNYGVGRNTVRRALGKLAALGFVKVVNHRYYVAEPDGWWRF